MARNHIEQRLGRIAELLAFGAGLALCGLMLLTVMDVGLRWLTGRGVPGAYAWVVLGMVGAGYLGMPYAEATKAHVRTPLLMSRLPVRSATVARKSGLIVAVVILGLMTYATATRAIESFHSGETTADLARLPLWPSRALIPIGLAALVLEYVIAIRKQAGHAAVTDEADTTDMALKPPIL